MAEHFATVQQGSEEGVIERASSRRRGHDLHTPQQVTPERGNRPKGDNNGPPIGAYYDAMLSVGAVPSVTGRSATRLTCRGNRFTRNW
jgi:hypothetical protein